MIDFKVTMDRSIRNITINRLFPGILGIIACLSILTAKQFEKSLIMTVGVLLIVASIIFTYLFLYLTSPVKYILNENELIIKRYIGSISIKLLEIQSVNIMDSSFMLEKTYTSVRNSGIFGYTGQCFLKGMKTRLFIKRVTENILITLSKENILVSPNDIIMAMDLIEAVENKKNYNIGL